ncbi:MAG: type IV secretory system conjugative DNA transfer family protein, partial [Oscillospiraceae bacterium]|nr:type IV secretory system conjugative DNA transfer family protein [Oscillospiraceae bacterium]
MKKSFRDSAPVWALFSLFVLYFAVLAASSYEDGMNIMELMAAFTEAMNKPFAISFNKHTPKFMLIALVAYAGAICIYYSSQQNRRPGEEHGSAKWGNVHELNRKYKDKDDSKNVILTKNLRMSMNGKLHMRNLLQIVVGGSGAGKTRFLVKPNIMLANASFICTDPKGEIARATIPLLLQNGYVVKVFDLIEPANSDSYNPFHYIRKDSDVFRLINNFIQNTTPKNASQSDPFWEKSEIALDAALMLYLLHEAPEYEQNMEMILTMIENGAAKEDDDDYKSPLDLLFEALEEEQPDHIALRQYRIFKQAAGNTAKSIIIRAA